MPGLAEVKVSADNKEEIAFLRERLISVQVTTTEDSEPEEKDTAVSLFPPEYLSQVSGLYTSIQASAEANPSLRFKDHVTAVTSQTTTELKQAKTISEAQVIKLKAQRLLLEPCIVALEALTSGQNSGLAELWRQLLVAVDQCFTDTLSSAATLQTQGNRDLTPNSEFESIEEDSKEVSDFDRLKQQWTLEKSEMEKEIDSLREENRKYLDLIIKHSKTAADVALRSARSLSPEGRPSQPGIINSKGLSLNQFKDFIGELFTAKSKFDQKCSQSRLPKESLATFLETHLTNKFGLKGLKQDWVNGVKQAINRYESVDNDVAVFGLILRNLCDEEFRFVQMQLKDTAVQLLRRYLKEKNPLKSVSDIENMTQTRVTGQLGEEEWTYIVGYMYNDGDAQVILGSIREMTESKPLSIPTSPKGVRLSREEALVQLEHERSLRSRIPYSEFLHVLLDFQLNSHMHFLSMLQKHYAEVDADKDGYIDEEEFKELVGRLNVGLGVQDLQRLLQLVDPYAYQRITFSQCTALFNSVGITQETVSGETISVLQKLSQTGREGMLLD